ncbi:MAG: Gfo/Idh/MocA family oxidoreductase [Verrucomicrobia bacterium]|nr:Gfo/Idh/MocA family oxidoreductase [Verrucomicrobiota bacterium]
MPTPNASNLASSSISRRRFIRNSSLALGTAWAAAPFLVRGQNLNSKIRVACIGVGGKGGSDTDSAYNMGGEIVGLCDVDRNTLNGKLRSLQKRARNAGKPEPQPKLYADFRKMLQELEQSIDAVTISPPDHVHGVAAVMAARMGKHIFCQKPLVQTVYEARLIGKLAREKKLCTQMGNQGSAERGLRRAVEVIQSGVIGNPRELHVWSNRPIWPQGIDRPPGEDPVPETLDWDLWLGPAQRRPYKNGVYHAFNWRGWFDYGTGALGDMACHTVNMPFRALKLGYPNVVEYEVGSRFYPETYPMTSRIRYEFPAREGLPPLKFWWYDGNPDPRHRIHRGNFIQPLRPPAEATKEIVALRDRLPPSGALIVGDKGKIFSPDDYGAQFYVILNDDKEYKSGNDHDACKAVPQSIPRSPGHDQEWFNAIQQGKPDLAYSNFDIAAYLTEIILLGCVALRVGENRLMEWDGPNMRSTNLPEAERFVKRDYRSGWEI